jgi:hypothetical protein
MITCLAVSQTSQMCGVLYKDRQDLWIHMFVDAGLLQQLHPCVSA